MVEANVKILRELRFFLDEVVADKELRKLLSTSPEAFSRNRKLPLQHLVSLLINQLKRSLSVELREFFDSLGNPTQRCTKGAFSLQRSKLLPLFFRIWNKWLVDHFYHYYGNSVKRWRFFLVQAVDGSTAYLVNKPEVAQYYGTQGNQYAAVPMARIVQVHDVLNDLTIWGDLYPITQAEPSIFAAQIPRLATDSLTLFDRGYPGYGLMYLMLNQETPRHFVMRCQSNFNKEVKDFLYSPESSKIVYLTPGKEAIAMLREHGYIVTPATPLKIRMVKITLAKGEKEVLLTSLYDEKLYSVEDLHYLYGLRWRIETTYNKQKNQQQLEQFSGHRVICIQQDYTAGVFTANLQSLIEKQCEPFLQQLNAKRKYHYQINRNVSWGALKNNIVKLFLEKDPFGLLQHLQKIFQQNTEPIRPGRKYQRVVKYKRKKGKNQTYTNYKRAI
jgi:Transposase DDE domain